jgi:hypothetical protein
VTRRLSQGAEDAHHKAMGYDTIWLLPCYPQANMRTAMLQQRLQSAACATIQSYMTGWHHSQPPATVQHFLEVPTAHPRHVSNPTGAFIHVLVTLAPLRRRAKTATALLSRRSHQRWNDKQLEPVTVQFCMQASNTPGTASAAPSNLRWGLVGPLRSQQWAVAAGMLATNTPMATHCPPVQNTFKPCSARSHTCNAAVLLHHRASRNNG